MNTMKTRLCDWSKLAKERVKRATDGSPDSTSNLSDSKIIDGPSQKDSQKSANSSFEVQSSHYNFSSFIAHESSLLAFQECSVKTTSPQSSSGLQHQSKSFPPRHLQRTSSISSESSLENLQVRYS